MLSAPSLEVLGRTFEFVVAPTAAGIAVFFGLAHLDAARRPQALRSHLRRASPLYLVSGALGWILASNWNRPGFWELGVIFLVPFEFFFGGILGDAVYAFLKRARIPETAL